MGISSRQREVLTVLSQREQWSLGEIATAVGVSHVAITKIVDRLESKGLVKRDVDYTDRRRVLVNLTRAGTIMLKRSMNTSENTAENTAESTNPTSNASALSSADLDQPRITSRSSDYSHRANLPASLQGWP